MFFTLTTADHWSIRRQTVWLRIESRCAVIHVSKSGWRCKSNHQNFKYIILSIYINFTLDNLWDKFDKNSIFEIIFY